jgi:membrane-anchored protein YejM (alkaline phosphatase superfamily)
MLDLIQITCLLIITLKTLCYEKVQILTDHLYLLTTLLYLLHVDSKYKQLVKISTFKATIYLKDY